MSTTGSPVHTTLGALAAAEEPLRRLGALSWPPRTAYTVRKLTALAWQELRLWHEQREAWIRELGTDPAADGRVDVKPEHVPEFLHRLADLAAVDVTIAWGPIPFAALEQAEDLTTHAPAKFSPTELLALGPLVSDPE